MNKPYLFIDFDRTLFDTEGYYGWLGEPRIERNQELIDGKRALPDFSQFIFPDTAAFLDTVSTSHHLVLLSFVKLDYSPKQVDIQEKKISGSGIGKWFAKGDIIITTESKGDEAHAYLEQHDAAGERFYFIDDEPKHLLDMHAQNPKVISIHLDRGGGMSGIPLGETFFASTAITVHSLKEALSCLIKK